MTDLSVEEWETLALDVVKQYPDDMLDLQHIIRFMPEKKLRSTSNEIIRSHAIELGEALTNLIKRGELIIAGSTDEGHVVFTLPTPIN